MSRVSVTAVASSASSSLHLHPHHQDALWQMHMRSRERMESGAYPVREDEPDCSYYIRTGLCRFGATCRFNHPPNRKLAIATARMKGQYPERIGQPECQGQVGSASHSENQQQTAGNRQNDGMSSQGEGINKESQFRFDSLPIGYYALQIDSVFPERPGQRECQFYVKTGDCKFGALCKFHHPRERLIPVPDCVLSSIGLPLRPGEPLCVFYSRYGICKFGPSCKFDHPMTVFPYNAAASPSSDDPAVCFVASSSGTVALSLSADGLVEAVSTNNNRLSVSKGAPFS